MMRRTLSLTALLSLLTTMGTAAQQWNADQLEVWDFEQRCWQMGQDQDLEARRDCFHEDYVGWYATDPAPMPYNDAVHGRWLETNRHIAFNMTPHTIMIHGDVAIVHLSGFIVGPGSDGKDVVSWEHWTDIALREDGRWSWIADHGHPGPVN